MYLETTANMESSNQQIEFEKMLRHNADEYIFSFRNLDVFHVLKVPCIRRNSACIFTYRMFLVCIVYHRRD